MGITCQKYSQNISASVREAFETVKSLIKEGSKYGYQLTSNLSISDKPEVAVEALKNLVKNLMRTKDEVEQDLSIGISAVSASGDASDGPEVPLANGEKSKKEKKKTPKKKRAFPQKKKKKKKKKS